MIGAGLAALGGATALGLLIHDHLADERLVWDFFYEAWLRRQTLRDLALPFAFGTLRSGGLPKRLFLGVLLAVGWFLLQRAVVNVASVYGVDFRLAHGLPALLLAAAAYVYFRRTS